MLKIKSKTNRRRSQKMLRINLMTARMDQKKKKSSLKITKIHLIKRLINIYCQLMVRILVSPC